MKHLIAALAMVAAPPALAWDAGDPAECLATWETLIAEFPVDWTNVDTASLVQPDLSPDGWCRLQAGPDGVDGLKFDTLDWRTQGVNRVLIDRLPPTALQVRMTAITAPVVDALGPRDLNVTLRHDSATRSLLIENFAVSAGEEHMLQVTAVLDYLDFTSRGAVAMSAGGTALSQAAGSLTVSADGDITELRDLPRAEVEPVLDRMAAADQTIFSQDSLAALRDYLITDQGKPGRLSFTIASERGLGLAQIFASRFMFGMDYGNDDWFLTILDGTQVSFDWRASE